MIIKKWVSFTFLPKIANQRRKKLLRTHKDTKFSYRLKTKANWSQLSTSWVPLQIVRLQRFDHHPLAKHLCLNLRLQQCHWTTLKSSHMKTTNKSRYLWCFYPLHQQHSYHPLAQSSVRAPNASTRLSGNQHRAQLPMLLTWWRKSRRPRLQAAASVILKRVVKLRSKLTRDIEY